MIRLRPLALLLGLGCFLFVGPALAGAGEAAAELSRWTDRLRRGRLESEHDADAQLRRLLLALRTEAEGEPANRQKLLLLCELVAVLNELQASEDLGQQGLATRLRPPTIFEGDRLLREDEALQRWLGSDVLLRREGPSVGRRAAAAELLTQVRSASALACLSMAARDDSLEVRRAALTALAGFDSEGVHRVFLDVLRRATEAPEAFAAEEHFRTVRLAARSPSVGALAQLCEDLLRAEDWHEACRAAVLCRALPDVGAIPLLIDALHLWVQRDASEFASCMRVRNEIASELALRSGRTLGVHPERWQTWWQAVQEGRTPSGAKANEDEVTRADFFGLRPASDRIVFVLDRSRSMADPFPSTEPRSSSEGTNRHQRAIEELTAFLTALGETAWFDVVVFGDSAHRWRSKLVPATEVNLRSAQAWLRRRLPQGSTQLRAGVAKALDLRAGGRFDPHHMEADTVVILCDGATSEGPQWVPSLLRKVHPLAHIRFDCVQIGGGGDGTLQRLAEGSGGEFVRILPH